MSGPELPDEDIAHVGHRLRVMADGDGFPLWGEDGWISPELAGDFLGLDGQLITDLLTWGRESGLSVLSPELIATRVERGEQLRARVQQQVGPTYTVELLER